MTSSEISIKRTFDRICNEFEEGWSSDRRYRIADALKQVEANQREPLLQMLLEIDVELRLSNGLTLDESDYAEYGEAAVNLVRTLLRSDERTLERLDNNSQVFEASIENNMPPGVPKQIGPYKLLQQIGEGGMGSVWMAEQEKPVRRRVALNSVLIFSRIG